METMDNGGAPKRIFDVSRPGATAATASGRPVIPSRGQVAVDPMMAPMLPSAVEVSQVPAPEAEVPVSPQPIPPIRTTSPDIAGTVPTPDISGASRHSFALSAPLFGAIQPSRFRKRLIIAGILLCGIVGVGVVYFLNR